MTLFPLSDCCHLLAIDPKTLHHWREQASMSLQVHPTDGRRKCLTLQQVQQLAVLHDRLLTPDEAGLSASLLQAPPPGTLEEPLPRPRTSEEPREKTPSTALLEEGEFRLQFSHLQALVYAQQQQLALLTQALLLERERPSDRHQPSLEVLAHPMREPEIAGSRPEKLTPSVHPALRPLHPAEQRARFLVLPPLIEYSASGTYVIISSQEGEIPLVPDSLEWFEWFRTLSSFRFVGQSGRFSACRGYRRHHPLRTWYAYRTLHQHDYKHYLGLSESLTLAHLEQMAAKFQSYVDAL